jgi:hypothetical protein
VKPLYPSLLSVTTAVEALATMSGNIGGLCGETEEQAEAIGKRFLHAACVSIGNTPRLTWPQLRGTVAAILRSMAEELEKP